MGNDRSTDLTLKVMVALVATLVTTLASRTLAQPTPLQACNETIKHQRIVGDRLVLVVPKRTNVKTGHDVDYEDYRIRFSVGNDDYYLEGIFGPTATDGSVPRYLADLGAFNQQAWSFRDPNAANGITGIDASGRYRNGNYWRYVGTGGESISYSDVPKAAADFFDTILSSLCYRPWTWKRKK